MRGVSEVLGNTPAVARRSYIDPRVFDRYQSGWTIGGEVDRIGRLEGPDDRRRARLEAAVLDLLHDDRASPAVERIDVGPADGGRDSAHADRARRPTCAHAARTTHCDRNVCVCDTKGRSAME